MLRFICHPDFLEEIEGDLLEKFESDCRDENPSVAKRKLGKEVFQLIRLNIVFNVGAYTPDIKKWVLLLAIALLFIAISFIPFLSGHYSKLAIGASALAQMAGFFGLALIPVGLVWLIIELRKSNYRNLKINRWQNGYYLSLLAGIPVLCFLSLLLILAFPEMNGIEWSIACVVFAAMIVFLSIRIYRLKNGVLNNFNTAPLYLILIPLVAFCTKNFLIEKVADTSRSKAIVQSGQIIRALDKYYLENGAYPGSLDVLKGKYLLAVPCPGIIGIGPYEYEKTGETYRLSFVQWLHWGATKEIVIYTQSGHSFIKGHFASFDTHYPGWRYYWND